MQAVRGAAITVQDTRRTCGSLLAALDVHPRAEAAADVGGQDDEPGGGGADG